MVAAAVAGAAGAGGVAATGAGDGLGVALVVTGGASSCPSRCSARATVVASLGIEPTVRHADYIGSWLEVLREDNRAIVRAASAASKAADYLLAFQIDPPQPIAIDLAASERHAA